MRKILITVLCFFSFYFGSYYAFGALENFVDNNVNLSAAYEALYSKSDDQNWRYRFPDFKKFQTELYRLYVRGDSLEVKSLLERLFDIEMDDLSVFRLGIEILEKKNQNFEIIKLCNRFISKHPKSIDPYLILNEIYLERGDKQLAREQITKALEIDENNFLANIAMGESIYSDDKPLQAVQYFSKAQSINPQELISYIQLGRIYYEQNEFRSAIEQLEKGKRIKDKDLKRSEFALLLDSMKKRININDKDLKKSQFVLQLKGLVLGPKNQGNYLKRIEQIALIEQIKKNQKLKNQGFKYIESDSLEELANYENKVYREDLEILSWLGLAYQKINDHSKAIETMKLVLDINPAHDLMRIELAKVYLAQGKYGKASEQLELVSEAKDLAYEKNVMLAFCYGALAQISKLRLIVLANPQVFLIVLGTVCLLFLVSLGLVGGLFIAAFLIGKRTRHKAVKYENVNWSLRQAFFVCIVLFSLPLCLEILLGKFIYNNWILFLSPARDIQDKAGQNALLSQLVTVLFTCAVVFWFALKRNGQNLRDLGFRWVKVRRFVFLAVKAVLMIFLFNAVYTVLFSALSGGQPDQQYIAEMISKTGKSWSLVILFLFAVIIGPFAEEIIFRGFIFSGLRKHCSFITAAIISACIFGIFHLQETLFIPLAFMGFILALMFERSRSILPAVVVHMLWNFIVFMNLIFLA